MEQANVKTKIYTKTISDNYRLTAGEVNSIKYLFRDVKDISEYDLPLPESVYKVLTPLKQHYPIIQIYSTQIDPDPIALGMTFSSFSIYDWQKNKDVSWKKFGYKEYEKIPAEKYKELRGMFGGCQFDNLGFDLLAQWGRELMPIETIVQKAKELYLRKEGNELKEQIIRAENELRLLEINADKKFITADSLN